MAFEVAGAAACLVLAVLVTQGRLEATDFQIREWALSHNTPLSVLMWIKISFMGSVAVLISFTFLCLAYFARLHEWSAFKTLSWAMGGAVILDVVIKWGIHRPRPLEAYPGTMPTSFSFPSGHALYSLTFYGALAFILSWRHPQIDQRYFWIVAVAVATVIGTSRIYLGVHYASDVLGGFLISATWLTIVLSYHSNKGLTAINKL